MVYSVSEITGYIKGLFENSEMLRHISVSGEVSNCKYHSSGHIYFTLKDNNAQIACVMFAGHRTGISFNMKDGQNVIVNGRISIYEASGRYQIYAEEIRLDGLGRLFEEYEALKKRLMTEGLFDVSKKKPIPKYAMKVGIVTAVTGAAIRDICQVSRRRNPYTQLILYPAQVQGEGASDAIVRGIKALDGKVDVIIVGRGGGSIEDLWAFNEEKTARAIFECETPIISAVGHEVDTTIADYVSDLRAPTPSAAAELAVFKTEELERDLAIRHERLYEALLDKIDSCRNIISNRELKLKNLSPRHKVEIQKQKLQSASERLRIDIHRILDEKKALLDKKVSVLSGLNPVNKLKSGFSYVTNSKGENINCIAKTEKGDELKIFVTDGVIYSSVNEVKKTDGR